MVTPRTRALTHALTLTHTRAHTHTALTRWFELGCVTGRIMVNIFIGGWGEETCGDDQFACRVVHQVFAPLQYLGPHSIYTSAFRHSFTTGFPPPSTPLDTFFHDGSRVQVSQ